MALQVYELPGFLSDKAAHQDAIAGKIADGWTFCLPITITFIPAAGEVAADVQSLATFTKDVAATDTMPQSIPSVTLTTITDLNGARRQ